jgi:two-component sensor histidine kinase
LIRLGFVKRAIVNERRSFSASLLLASCAVLSAIVARLFLGRWVEGVPFLTFFPAVLLASLFLGWRWGAAVALASGGAANFFFVAPEFSWALGDAALISTLAFLFSAALMLLTTAALRSAVTEINQKAEREAALNAELQHRVKNNLAVIQGLARQTVKSASDPSAFYDAFLGRLVALGEAHNVLSAGKWEECQLPDLPQAALRPFQERGATLLSGPTCTVPPESCVPLALALHELATNAVKYGALSVSSGEVSLAWAIEDGKLALRWEETGGPEVRPPTRRGLGSRLLAKQTGLESVTLDFRRPGLVCEIIVKGARLLN